MPSSAPLRVAVVCMSNMNRSMEAHSILSKKGFRVRSFGAGSMVRLPGPAHHRPVLYSFRTPYRQMRRDLAWLDPDCYRRNGILHLLGRNERIKPCPERFQDCREAFDVIFTCEESVYDRVVGHLCAQEQERWQPMQVINVDMQDDLEDATLGSLVICELCQRLQQAEDMEDCLAELLLGVERKTGRSFLHTVCFY
uniref:RNA polymerase II subunit A C-terminal domain phosphatase SSU72 n=1 Tax=Sus scrofa TaxID=9823 RepID=A0A8D2CBJ4_PIG